MYYLVRAIIGAIFFVIAVVICRRFFRGSRPKRAAVGAAACLLWILSGIVPFENWFYTFPSLEAAYKYYGKSAQYVAVEGESSALVITQDSRRRNTQYIKFFVKEKDGWGLSSAFDLKVQLTASEGNFWIHVYRYKDSEDFFVMLSDWNYKQLQVSDQYGTGFIEHSWPDNVEEYSYYGFIRSWAEPYIVVINGRGVVFESK